MVIEFGNLKNIKLNARVLRRWNSLSELQKFYMVDLNIFLLFNLDAKIILFKNINFIEYLCINYMIYFITYLVVIR